ncbi:MAG TPA: PDZ domain-containing protein [Deltaproteobacteria bacterium]|nr:PDZ domain-containing protein [Deltaproteobacteria bacterium]
MTRQLRIVNILLLLSLFPLSSVLVRDYVVYRYSAPPAPVRESGVTPAPAMPAFDDYRPVVESGVFPSKTRRLTAIDMAAASAAEERGAGAKAGPAVNENLVLLGVVTGPRLYAAFHDRKSRSEEVFAVGDELFGSGTIEEITARGVRVRVGATTVFYTIDEEDDGAAGRAATPSLAPPVERGRPPMTAPPSGPSPLSKKVGEGEWVIDRQAVLAALEDMSQVLSDARLFPNTVDGRIKGFRVTEVRPRGIFDAIGLRNGDVLLSVNGYEISSPERAIQVLTGLKGNNSIRLDIIRDGRNVSFNYRMQ